MMAVETFHEAVGSALPRCGRDSHVHDSLPPVDDLLTRALSQVAWKQQQLAACADPVGQSAEIFGQISIPWLLDDDRRECPRRDSFGFVSVARFPQGSDVTPQWLDWLLETSGIAGELIDLSMSGVALLLLQPLSEQEEVALRLTQRESTLSIDTTARVIRSIDIGDGRWKIVAQFRQPLTFEQAFHLSQRQAAST